MSLKRLDAHLSKLGYCTRGEVKKFLKMYEVCVDGIRVFNPSQKVNHNTITIDKEPIDPLTLTLLFHKPKGVVCSHDDSGKLIYSLLPTRWQNRNPKLSTVGRLDRDTTGAILLSDDGELNHRLTSPKSDIPKVYKVTLAHPLRGDEEDIFQSGTLMLHGEEKPLLPANLKILNEKTVLLEIKEGRYHQVKRMFGAVGNRVQELHRVSFGDFSIEDVEEGIYKIINTTKK
jgi:16S rRNA pseudouridine516 synthase